MKIKRVDDKPMIVHTKEKSKIHVKSARAIDVVESHVSTVNKDPRYSGKQAEYGDVSVTGPKSARSKGNGSNNARRCFAVGDKLVTHKDDSQIISREQTVAGGMAVTGRKIKAVGYRAVDSREGSCSGGNGKQDGDLREKRNIGRLKDVVKAREMSVSVKKGRNTPSQTDKIDAVKVRKSKVGHESSFDLALLAGRELVNELEGGREVSDSVQVGSVIAMPVVRAAVAGKNLYINKVIKSRAENRVKRAEIKRKAVKNNGRYGTNNRSNNDNIKNQQPRPIDEKTQPSKPTEEKTQASTTNDVNTAQDKYKKDDSVQSARHKSSNKAVVNKKVAGNRSNIDTAYSGRKRSTNSSGGRAYGSSVGTGSGRVYGKGGSDSATHGGGAKGGTGKTARNRMIQLFIAKLKQENNEDSLIKALKDIVAMRFSVLVKKAVTFLFLKLAIIFGAIAIVALPVIVVLAVIYNSPFAILFPSISSGETTQAVLSAYVREFKDKVEDEARHHTGYDYSEIVYVDYEGAGTPDNFVDILMVYMVKHGIGDTATDMTAKAKQNLGSVFDDMASFHVTYGEVVELEEVEVRDEYGFRVRDEDDNVVTEWVEITYKVKYVNVRLRTAHEMISRYSFNNNQKEMLLELMRPENLAYIGYNPGGGAGVTLTDEQFRAIVDAISDANGKKVVTFALSKVGYPYSQVLRDSGTHFDCSSLTYYAWRTAGINLTYQGSNVAAQQGKFLYDNNLLVNYSDMRPGDLIFYSTANNGRFANITHVAIFVGNSMMVDAANSNLGVVYRSVNTRNIVFIGRPR